VEQPRREVVPLRAGFRLGRGGWYVLEQIRGETFRWVRDRAEIIVTDAAATTLELDVEPGPGVGGKPLALTVRDARGEPIACACVEGRRRIAIELPSAERVPYAIALCADGGGATVPGFVRVLDFRVFHVPPA
jgi:hypothetical protein